MSSFPKKKVRYLEVSAKGGFTVIYKLALLIHIGGACVYLLETSVPHGANGVEVWGRARLCVWVDADVIWTVRRVMGRNWGERRGVGASVHCVRRSACVVESLYENELRSFFTHRTRVSVLLSGGLETNPFAVTMGCRQHGPSRRPIHCPMTRATEPQRLTHGLCVTTYANAFTCGERKK